MALSGVSPTSILTAATSAQTTPPQSGSSGHNLVASTQASGAGGAQQAPAGRGHHGGHHGGGHAGAGANSTSQNATSSATGTSVDVTA